MKTEQTNKQTIELINSYGAEAENAYVLYAFWAHELKHDDPILWELYCDWKRAEDIYYDSLNES